MESSKETEYQYVSIENMLKWFISIRIEEPRDIEVFHKIFDGEKGDCIIHDIMTNLYPDGRDITEEEIDKIKIAVLTYMKRDKKCIHQYAEYDKKHCSSYIYSKALDKVYPTEFGLHLEMTIEACIEFFEGDSDVTPEKIRKHLYTQIEIKSDNTIMDSLLLDAPYIANMCEFRRKHHV